MQKTVQQTWERDVLDPSKDVMVLYEAAVSLGAKK